MTRLTPSSTLFPYTTLFRSLPIGLAPGMGVNAFFVGVIIGQYGYTWQEALALSFIGGILFLIISLTPIRRTLIQAIPQDLKDRKSTRLNSSHVRISYAVFCL